MLTKKYHDHGPFIIGPMTVDRFWDHDTNRTIVSMDPAIYDEMTVDGLSDRNLNPEFSIVRYKLHKHNYHPDLRNDLVTGDMKLDAMATFPYNLLEIKIPTGMYMDYARRHLQNNLDFLIILRIINPQSYEIKIPYTSREGYGNHLGKAHINMKECTLQQVFLVRSILNGTSWKIEGKDQRVSCSWTRINHQLNNIHGYEKVYVPLREDHLQNSKKYIKPIRPFVSKTKPLRKFPTSKYYLGPKGKTTFETRNERPSSNPSYLDVTLNGPDKI